jgi:hypothetical protein
MLVVANLHPGQAISGQIRLPLELSEAIGLPARLAIHLVLDRFGSGTTRVGTYTREAMDEIGFHIAIPNQTSHVYRLESIAP